MNKRIKSKKIIKKKKRKQKRKNKIGIKKQKLLIMINFNIVKILFFIILFKMHRSGKMMGGLGLEEWQESLWLGNQIKEM